MRPPDAGIARDPEVRAAGRSVVRVPGTACGLGVQGSGWVAGDGVVVTNAHVVAGQDDTTVQVEGEGPRLDAEAIHFDAKNDLAVLRVPGVSGRARLALNEGARVGTSAAVLGFPENGPYDVRPGRLGQTETVISQDAYGRGPVQAPHHRAARAGAVGQLGRARGGRPGPRGHHDLRRRAGSGSSSGFGVPDSIVREALARSRWAGGHRSVSPDVRPKLGLRRAVHYELRPCPLPCPASPASSPPLRTCAHWAVPAVGGPDSSRQPVADESRQPPTPASTPPGAPTCAAPTW